MAWMALEIRCSTASSRSDWFPSTLSSWGVQSVRTSMCRFSSFSRLMARAWSGHSALLDRVPRPWQAVGALLGQFGRTPRRARAAYHAFVAAGLPQGRRPELQGGGLLRSLGGWQAVQALRRGREAYAADERVLGGPEFVEALRAEAQRTEPQRARLQARTPDLATLLRQVAAAAHVSPTALTGGGRSRPLARVRDGLAYLWVEVLGRSGRTLARALALQPVSVYRAARRGRDHRAEWDRLAAR